MSNVLVAHKQDEFDKLFREIEDGKPYLIDFTAAWCGPCKMIAPVFDRLSLEYPHVAFLKVDVDGCPKAAKAFDVSAMPTFVLGRAGLELSRLRGASESKLQAMLESLKHEDS